MRAAWQEVLNSRMTSHSRLGIEDQNPIFRLAVGRRNKLVAACVEVLSDGQPPRSVARVVPPGCDLRAVELVQVNANWLADRCVRDHETSVFGPPCNDAMRALALSRSNG